MKYLSFISIFFLSIVLYSCQQKAEFEAKPFDKKNPDFSFLDKALQGKRIVALGESSHGLGDLQTLKGQMVKYLHDKLGYEVLIMNAGYGDASIAYNSADKMTAKELRNSTLYGNFRSSQMLPMFDYIKNMTKTDRPLYYKGYDTQVSGQAFRYRLMYVVKRIEPKIIQDSVTTGLDAYAKMHKVKDDVAEWTRLKNKLNAGIHLAKSILEENVDDIREKEFATDTEVGYLNRTLDMLKASIQYDYGQRYGHAFMLRDSLMAENVSHIVEKELKGKKIILWGHNGHLDKEKCIGDNYRWMGHILKDRYQDDYYTLGMFAHKGQFFTHWDSKTNNFDISKDGFLEKKLNDTYKSDVFVNLPAYDSESKEWYQQPIKCFEPDGGGAIDFIPTKRFDGLLMIQETRAPKLTRS